MAQEQRGNLQPRCGRPQEFRSATERGVPPLSVAERTALRLFLDGAAIQEIASVLRSDTDIAERHLKAVCEKFGTSSLPDLAIKHT